VWVGVGCGCGLVLCRQVGQAFQDLCSYGVPNGTPPREAKIASIHQRHAWNGFEIGYSMAETPSAQLRRITKCRVPLHPERREKSRLGGSLGRRDGVSSGGERAARAAHAMGRDTFPSRDLMPGYVDMYETHHIRNACTGYTVMYSDKKKQIYACVRLHARVLSQSMSFCSPQLCLDCVIYRTWTQREDLNQKVERRLCKEQQVEKWQRKTVCLCLCLCLCLCV
jgi:hypothetical protein